MKLPQKNQSLAPGAYAVPASVLLLVVLMLASWLASHYWLGLRIQQQLQQLTAQSGAVLSAANKKLAQDHTQLKAITRTLTRLSSTQHFGLTHQGAATLQADLDAFHNKFHLLGIWLLDNQGKVLLKSTRARWPKNGISHMALHPSLKPASAWSDVVFDAKYRQAKHYYAQSLTANSQLTLLVGNQLVGNTLLANGRVDHALVGTRLRETQVRGNSHHWPRIELLISGDDGLVLLADNDQWLGYRMPARTFSSRTLFNSAVSNSARSNSAASSSAASSSSMPASARLTNQLASNSKVATATADRLALPLLLPLNRTTLQPELLLLGDEQAPVLWLSQPSQITGVQLHTLSDASAIFYQASVKDNLAVMIAVTVAISVWAGLVSGFMWRRRKRHQHQIEHGLQELQRLNSQLNQLADTDTLTQCPNRRAANAQLRHRLIQLQRYQQPFSVAMLDIDYFKEINDQYGHEIGDQVLCHLVLTARAVIDSSHVLARIGTNTFLLIFPDTHSVQARKITQCLLDTLAAYPLLLGDCLLQDKLLTDKNIHFTISGGLTEAQSGDDIQQLLVRAEDYLYAAKKQGHCRIIGEHSFRREA